MTSKRQHFLAVSDCVKVAIFLSVLSFSCTRRPEKLLMGNDSKKSSLAAVKITPPPALSKQIQSGLINAMSVEIIPGPCQDGSTGTRLKKTMLELQSITNLESIKVKSKCDYKILIEMGQMDQTTNHLEKVFLTNATSPTVLKSEDVTGGAVKVRATLLITSEGQPIIDSGLLQQDLSPPSDDKPQDLNQDDISPMSSDGQSTRLDFMRYDLPVGYSIAQTAKDNVTRMASVTRESKRLVLFIRKDRCDLKDYLSSSAQVVRTEKAYTSSKDITWSTLVSKFSSPFTRKTLYNGMFVFVKNGSCAFGYVSTSSQDSAEAEMRAILDGASLLQ